MTFIFIKLLSTALYPLFTSILLIGGGLALRRFRRFIGLIFVLIGLAYLYLCSTWEFAAFLADRIEKDFHYVEVVDVAPADAILVLGGGVGYSGGKLELYDSADRVLAGAKLAKAGKAPLVFVSGSSPFGGESQSGAMKEFLLELEVPDSWIVEENEARNTYEHAVHLKPLFEERGIRSVIVVTSAWHMRRSRAVLESHLSDYEYTFFPVDSKRGKTYSPLDYLPTVGALEATTAIIKEKVGYLLYDIRGYIR